MEEEEKGNSSIEFPFSLVQNFLEISLGLDLSVDVSAKTGVFVFEAFVAREEIKVQSRNK